MLSKNFSFGFCFRKDRKYSTTLPGSVLENV